MIKDRILHLINYSKLCILVKASESTSISLGILIPEIGDFKEILFSFFNFQMYELKSITFVDMLPM